MGVRGWLVGVGGSGGLGGGGGGGGGGGLGGGGGGVGGGGDGGDGEARVPAGNYGAGERAPAEARLYCAA
ncbi:hypothetical protein HmCmsJML022_04469 [Escherichia coli]|nr:hypothetical protein HmCmsJML022_04469 [Escherichia coli]